MPKQQNEEPTIGWVLRRKSDGLFIDVGYWRTNIPYNECDRLITPKGHEWVQVKIVEVIKVEK